MRILIDGQIFSTPYIRRRAGIDFKSMLQEMVKSRQEHIWYVFIKNRHLLTDIDPWVASRLKPIEGRHLEIVGCNDAENAYTAELEKIITEKQIDAYWNPGPLLMGTLFLSRRLPCKMFCAEIVAEFEAFDENKWPEAYKTEYDRRRAFLSREVCVLDASGDTMQNIERTVYDAEETGTARKRLALVTPWPPMHSGIANFEYRLIPHLNRYFQTDIFVYNDYEEKYELLKNEYGGLYNISELDKRHDDYNMILYQFGNNTRYHGKIYHYARKYRGLGEIHDLVLNGFFNELSREAGDEQILLDAISLGYGDAGVDNVKYALSIGERPYSENFPMFHTIQEITDGVIVHNAWSAEQLGLKENVFIIPLPAYETREMTEAEKTQTVKVVKERICYQPDEKIVGCFGDINENKRPDKVIESVKALVDKGHRIRLVFWGRSASNISLQAMAKKCGLENCVVETGYLDEKEYETGILLSDVVVNLRHPSIGESSGPLCEGLRHGKPIIISAENQYCEFPDDVCWKVSVDEYETKALSMMIERLLYDDEVRQMLGENAKRYAKSVLSPERLARLYDYAVTDTIESLSKR